MMISCTSSETSGAGFPVFGFLYAWSRSITPENEASVFFCRLDAVMRAASRE